MTIFLHTSLVKSSVGSRGKQITSYGVVFGDMVFVSARKRSVSRLESRWVSSRNHENLLVFGLFEEGKSSFNSFSSQLKLLFVNCHTVCVVTCGRRTKKEKSDLCTFDFCLSSETNLLTLAYLEISRWYCKIQVNCKFKFDCGAKNDPSFKLYALPPNLSFLKFSREFLLKGTSKFKLRNIFFYFVIEELNNSKLLKRIRSWVNRGIDISWRVLFFSFIY